MPVDLKQIQGGIDADLGDRSVGRDQSLPGLIECPFDSRQIHEIGRSLGGATEGVDKIREFLRAELRFWPGFKLVPERLGQSC